MNRILQSTNIRAALRARQRGFLLWPSRLAGPAGPTFADVTNNPFSSSFDGNWTQLNTDWGTVGVSSGVCACNASNTNNEGAVVHSGGTYTANSQFAEIEIGGLSFLSADFLIGVIICASTDTGAGRDCYFGYVAADSGGPNYTTVMGKYVSGTRTVLRSATSAWANTDKVGLGKFDGVVVLLKNRVPLAGTWADGASTFSQTDSSLTTGNPGIIANGTSPTGDNWVGGNLS